MLKLYNIIELRIIVLNLIPILFKKKLLLMGIDDNQY